MKTYTEFVQRIYQVIVDLYQVEQGMGLRIFAEGSGENLYSGNQEYAILRNKKAEIFITVIQNHLELLGISEEMFHVKHSMLYPSEVKITHSCYPKNMRRWLSGTVSRKKKCRIEFCVLVYCHAIGWDLSLKEENSELVKCRQELWKICMDYLSDVDKQYFMELNKKEVSFEMLWRAGSFAYLH